MSRLNKRGQQMSSFTNSLKIISNALGDGKWLGFSGDSGGDFYAGCDLDSGWSNLDLHGRSGDREEGDQGSGIRASLMNRNNWFWSGRLRGC